MKIYVVLYGHDWGFEGAFTTREKAQEYIDRRKPDNHWLWIKEFEIDEGVE